MASGTLKILSGGQTGVDRAALDTAIEKGLAYGGWCPRGGWAEDLPEPPGLLAIYPHLQETPLSNPAQRTEWNVHAADRLMVLVDHAGVNVSKGTVAARDFAERLGKPLIVLDIDVDDALEGASGFLGRGEGTSSLCIAGPRESEARLARQRLAVLCGCDGSLLSGREADPSPTSVLGRSGGRKVSTHGTESVVDAERGEGRLPLLLAAVLDDGAQDVGRQDAEDWMTASASAHGFLPRNAGHKPTSFCGIDFP